MNVIRCRVLLGGTRVGGGKKGSSRGKPSWHGGNAPEGEKALIGVAKTP